MRNSQVYQQKTEKFSISEEKKYGKIDSRFTTGNVFFVILKYYRIDF